MTVPFSYQPPRIVNVDCVKDESRPPKHRLGTAAASPARCRPPCRKRRGKLVGFVALVLLGSTQAYAGQPLVCLIQPSNIAEVGTSVYGAIAKINVERGDQVEKDQVVAELRNDIEHAALNVARSKALADADVKAAQANLEYSRQNLQRAESLIEKHYISQQELDHIRTELKMAEQKLAQAKEQRGIWKREMELAESQLSQRNLVSPIAGIVAERYLSLGERVENNPVVRIVTIDPLYVEVMVPAMYFGKIKPDMTATVQPELPDTPAREAKVILIDKLVDGASNTFRVRLQLSNTDQSLPAGLRCKADFGLEAKQPASTSSTFSVQPQSPR